MIITFLILTIIALAILLTFFFTLAWLNRHLLLEFGELRKRAGKMNIADFIEGWTAIGVKFWKEAQK